MTRADEAGEIDYPEDTPIKPNTVRNWKSVYGFLTEDELEEMMRKRRRPLTLADLRRKKLDTEFRNVVADHPAGGKS